MKYHSQPHSISPSIDTARVVLAIKNFSSIPGVCHIGLGVTALNTMKVLRRAGIHVEAWSTQSAKDLRTQLSAAKSRTDYVPISHVIVSSPAWVQPADFATLCLLYPEIEFVMLNHSGTSYLSIDKYGIRNIREDTSLSLAMHNLTIAANNPRLANAINGMFGGKCILLPNLYDVGQFMPYVQKPIGSVLRIFNPGASRPWKNQLAAAEAAVMLARTLGVQLDYRVNSKRPDGGERMIESREELFANLPGCTLTNVEWMSWPTFRSNLSIMHLVFEPSFDETFNVCVADAYASGTPAVTAPSIEWAPRSSWCEPCDPQSIVDVSLGLLHNQQAVEAGRAALTTFVKNGTSMWLDFILKR
jgi:hypothetical protein